MLYQLRRFILMNRIFFHSLYACKEWNKNKEKISDKSDGVYN
jgi:hypothetical protein